MSEQEAPPQLTPEQTEEVLMPDLSSDSFIIGDKKYKIRMLPMFYERRLFNLMKANWAALTDTGSWMDFADVLIAKLPEVVALICYSQGAKGVDPTGAWNEEKFQEIAAWIERVACGRDLYDIVTKQAEKNRLMDLAQGLLAQGNLMGKLGSSLSMQP
jgi:hypothetical protein